MTHQNTAELEKIEAPSSAEPKQALGLAPSTMPAVLYLGVTHDHKDCLSCEAYYSSSDIDGFEGPTGKYIRADLHTDILKQALDALKDMYRNGCNQGWGDNYEYSMKQTNRVLTAIDEALGENK